MRDVALLPLLRDELLALKAGRDPELDELVFGTTHGTPQSASNVRQRVLHRSVTRANKLLAKRKAAPLPEALTLHSLRRTYASLLFALGRTAPEVMAQLGHTDARLTLRVYARAMSQDEGERERLQTLVDGRSLGTNGHWSPPDASAVSSPAPRDRPRNTPICRPFRSGASRARTDDLLHAMQALSQLSYSPACARRATNAAMPHRNTGPVADYIAATARSDAVAGASLVAVRAHGSAAAIRPNAARTPTPTQSAGTRPLTKACPLA